MPELLESVFAPQLPANLDPHKLHGFFSRLGIQANYLSAVDVVSRTRQLLQSSIASNLPFPVHRVIPDLTPDALIAQLEDLETALLAANAPTLRNTAGNRNKYHGKTKGNEIGALLVEPPGVLDPELWDILRYLFLARICLDNKRTAHQLREDATSLRLLADRDSDRLKIQGVPDRYDSKARYSYFANILDLAQGRISQQTESNPGDTRPDVVVGLFLNAVNQAPQRFKASKLTFPNSFDSFRELIRALANTAEELNKKHELPRTDRGTSSKPAPVEPPNLQKDDPNTFVTSDGAANPKTIPDVGPNTSRRKVKKGRGIREVSKSPEALGEPSVVGESIRIQAAVQKIQDPTARQSLQRFWIQGTENTNRASAASLSPEARAWLLEMIASSDLSEAEAAARRLIIMQITLGVDLSSDFPSSSGASSANATQNCIEMPIPDSIWEPDPEDSEFFSGLLDSSTIGQPQLVEANQFQESCDEAEIRAAYDAFMRQLSEANGSTVQKRKLKALLATEVWLGSRNLMLKGIFTRSNSGSLSMPAMAWYMGIREERVRDAFNDACRALLGLTIDESPLPSCDTRSTVWEPNTDHLAEAISRARGDAERLVSNSKADLIERHTCYTHYTLWLLEFSLGFRPVNDPVGTYEHLDLESGYCVLCDKVTIPELAYRLVKLGEVARAQLAEYRKYLHWLSAELATNPSWISAAKAIRIVAEGTSKPTIPLFFNLSLSGSDDKNGPKLAIEHLNTKHQQEAFHKYAPIAANEGRRWLATQLDRRGIPYEWIVALLGHHEQSAHSFGKLSLHAPAEAFNAVTKEVDALSTSIGLTPLPVKLRVGSRKRRLAEKALVAAEGQAPLELEPAHFERERQRLKVQHQHRALVDQHVAKLGELKSGDEVTHAQVANLYAQATKEAVSQNLSIQRTSLLIEKRLAALRRKHIKVPRSDWFFVDPEPSPFRDDAVRKYVAANAAQAALTVEVQRLASLHRKGDTLRNSPEQRRALSVLTAAFFSGIADQNKLDAIAKGHYQLLWIHGNVQLVVRTTIKVGGTSNAPVLDDINSIIALDTTTAGLVCALAAADTVVHHDRVDDHLRKIAEKINLPIRGKESITAALARSVASLNLFQSTGLARSISASALVHRSLPVSAIARLTQEKPLKAETPNLASPDAEWLVTADSLNSGLPMASKARQEARRTGLLITRLARQIVKSGNKPIEVTLPPDEENGETPQYLETEGLAEGDERDRLKGALDWIIERLPKQKMSSHLQITLARYVAHQCQEQRGRLAWSTIREYHQIVIRLLGKYLEADLVELEDADFEELYFLALETSTPARRQKTANVLRQFHRFLVRDIDAPPVDWSYIYALGDWVLPDAVVSIDANYIFHHEYEQALSYIRQLDLDQPTKDQLAFLLIQGARFGKRWSEALHVRSDHAVLSVGKKLRMLLVRPTHERTLKTRSAQRRIPLVGYLSDEEQAITHRVIERHTQLYGEMPTSSAPPLLDKLAGAKAVVSGSVTSRVLNQALKQATGDANVRFHHLRHTYCSALLAIALAPTLNKRSSLYGALEQALLKTLGLKDPKWPQLWGDEPIGPHTLQTVAELMGHASPGTSIRAYAHFWDTYAGSHHLSTHEPDDSVMSFATGLPYGGFVKRKLRCPKTQPWNLAAMYGPYNVEQHGHQLAMLVSEQNTQFESSYRGGGKISLLELDNACRRLNANHCSKEALAETALLAGIDADLFRRSAMQAERISGYDRFQLRRLDPSAQIHDAVSPPFRNHRENAAIRAACEALQPAIDDMTKEDLDRVNQGLALLCSGHETNTRCVVIVTQEDYATVKTALHLLGWGGCLSDACNADTQSDKPLTGYKAHEPAKSYKQGQIYQLNYPEELTTSGAVIRAAFLVVLYCLYASLTN